MPSIINTARTSKEMTEVGKRMKSAGGTCATSHSQLRAI